MFYRVTTTLSKDSYLDLRMGFYDEAKRNLLSQADFDFDKEYILSFTIKEELKFDSYIEIEITLHVEEKKHD